MWSFRFFHKSQILRTIGFYLYRCHCRNMFNIYILVFLSIIIVAKPGYKIISRFKFAAFSHPFWPIILCITIRIYFFQGKICIYIFIILKSVTSIFFHFKSIPCICLIIVILHCNRILTLNKLRVFIKINLFLDS